MASETNGGITRPCPSWCDQKVWEDFTKCLDYQILTGVSDIHEEAKPYTPITEVITYEHPYHYVWPMYAWTAFCLQWMAIGWAMIVGKE